MTATDATNATAADSGRSATERFAPRRSARPRPSTTSASTRWRATRSPRCTT